MDTRAAVTIVVVMALTGVSHGLRAGGPLYEREDIKGARSEDSIDNHLLAMVRRPIQIYLAKYFFSIFVIYMKLIFSFELRLFLHVQVRAKKPKKP